jgi:drug/metabolite transporter (DMT)-like permease
VARPRPNEVTATFGLLFICVLWGSTFLVVKDAIGRMPVSDFLAWRFAIAALAMLALRPRSMARLGPTGRRRGGWLGLALAAGYLFQTYGLRTTPSSVSGFITGMFVVFTPLIAGAVLRRRVGAAAWVGVAVATGGLALLSLHGFAVGRGELLTVGCAIAFAVHIVGLGEWSSAHDPAGLAAVQLTVVTAVSCCAALIDGGLGPPPDFGVWGALLLTAVAATALAFVVQTWAQRVVAPTRAAVIMTTEPAFAGLFGVAAAGDHWGARQVVGAALVLVAMLAVEVGPRRGAEGETARLEV